MSWPIRFLESPPLHGADADSRSYDGTVDFRKMAIGDLCFYHYRGAPLLDRERLQQLHLTAHYFLHNAKRAPLILALPDKAYPDGKLYFLVDGQCYSGQKGHYDGWTVAGDPPAITVSPSVNYDDEENGIKHYHGHIQNGVIGDG
ncbi:MAG: hypothetical protein ABI790_02330 [Betaproteobacteria bacterium]